MFFSVMIIYVPGSNVSMNFTRRMMTSSYGSIFRVAGRLCGEFAGHR